MRNSECACHVKALPYGREAPRCAGVPEYNCDVNALKTMKNFHVLPNGRAELDSDGGLGDSRLNVES